ncbi:MAG: DUF3618 domain-containing protein [Chloroflexota bacterium]
MTRTELDLHAGDLPSDEPEGVDDSPELIRADIETTRVEMGGTLNELGDRLDPGRLMSQAKETVRDATIGRVEGTARGITDMVMETVKRNPVAAVLAGIGLAMLWRNRNADSGSGTGALTSKVGDAAWSVGENVGSAASTVGRTVGNAADEVAYRSRDAVDTVGSQLDQVMQASPLALAAVAAGAGALVGALIPATEAERQVLAEPAQKVAGTVRDNVSTAMDKVEEQADKIQQKAEIGY